MSSFTTVFIVESHHFLFTKLGPTPMYICIYAGSSVQTKAKLWLLAILLILATTYLCLLMAKTSWKSSEKTTLWIQATVNFRLFILVCPTHARQLECAWVQPSPTGEQ